MNGKLPATRTDWSKVDTHVIQPEEYEDLPEWTEEMFDAAEVRDGDSLVRCGRPADPLHTTSNGLQARMNETSQDWAKLHIPA